MIRFPPRALLLLAFSSVVLLAWLAYRPGLTGSFLFDDFVNLDALARYGPVDSWPALFRYLTSGTADPTGRPVALASFLIDARTWPAEPAHFLRTNLLLHLVNGCLLLCLLRQLEGWRTHADPQRRNVIALAGMAAWLLHPLLVSTTLYVVQREAMLSTTCVFGGLALFLAGARRFADSEGARGSGWMVTGVVGGTALGLLCKANGALLPLLAWVLVSTIVIAPTPSNGSPTIAASPRWRRLTALLLVVPSVALFLYLLHFIPEWNQVPAGRPWTIGQRFLTEFRVLLDYLRLLLMPRSLSNGLYHDDLRVSNGLMDPATTLWSALTILLLVCTALLGRRRWPRFGAALLFFFAAHLLESSVVPLELSFEHRNYLPSALLAWPLAAAVVNWRRPAGQRALVAAVAIGLLAAITWQRSSLWGKPSDLSSAWALRNPDSPRAQAAWAIDQRYAGNAATALAKLQPLWRSHPADVQIAVNAFDAACSTRRVTVADRLALGRTIRTATADYDLLRQWLADRVLDDGHCLSTADIDRLLSDAAANRGFNPVVGGARNILPLRGALALREHHPADALAFFNGSFLADPRPDVAFNQAVLMAAQGAYPESLAHIDFYERHQAALLRPRPGMPWLHARVLEWQHYWPLQFGGLRQRIAIAMHADKSPHATGVPSS